MFYANPPFNLQILGLRPETLATSEAWALEHFHTPPPPRLRGEEGSCRSPRIPWRRNTIATATREWREVAAVFRKRNGRGYRAHRPFKASSLCATVELEYGVWSVARVCSRSTFVRRILEGHASGCATVTITRGLSFATLGRIKSTIACFRYRECIPRKPIKAEFRGWFEERSLQS